MKGRSPTKAEKTYMDKTCQLGCVVCRVYHSVIDTYVSFHHIDGRTKDYCHFNGIPLCSKHHQKQDDNPMYEAVHPYKARFEQRYGTEKDLLRTQNNLLRDLGEWQDDWIDMGAL